MHATNNLAACFLLGWLVWLSTTAAYGGEARPLATAPGSGITASIEGWAGIDALNSLGRDVGFVPIVVTIANATSVDRVWTVEGAHSRSYGAGIVPETRLAVPAGSLGRVTLYIDPGLSGSYSQIYVTVRGYGLIGGEQGFSMESLNPSMSTVTMSGYSSATSVPLLPSAISSSALAKCGDALKGYSAFPASAALELTAAPDDWRGWSALSCLLLDESDWIAMSAGQRKALLDWVGLGRRAGLMVTDQSPQRLDRIGLPAADPDGRRRVGAGELVSVPWDGVEFDAAELDRFLDGQPLHPRSDRLTQYSTFDPSTGSSVWFSGFTKLFNVFGPRQLPVVAILCFIVILALVAGPLNLLVLAGPGRRSRMFWTTPLVSLLATAVLLGLVFLRDGVGGAGARRVLCLLMPEQNAVAIIQEQFSRTGVLFSSSFAIQEPSWMRPLAYEDKQAGLTEVDGRRRQGDWFSSRSDRGHIVETVRPSRAKIEFAVGGDAPPAVISSIEVPLERLFLIDESGNYWKAENIGTGQRKPLEPSDADAYTRWYDSLAADAGPIRAAAIAAVRNRRGHVYADASPAAKIAVETLPSIRWVDDKAFFIGPFTRSAAL
jgi:hypothetical protein